MPEKTKLPKVTIRGARLLFRNFSGGQTPFNEKGKRNFNVVLDNDTAEAMQADGWNVRYLRQREDEVEATAVIKVTVKFKDGLDASRQPRIVMITSRGRTTLDSKACSALDFVLIVNADLILSPYHWKNAAGKEGVAAYLDSLYATIFEDELELKYADLPEISGSAVSGMITMSSEILAIERGNPDDQTPF